MKTIAVTMFAALALSLAACGDDTQPMMQPPDLSTPVTMPDMATPQNPPDLGCYGMPMTHVQIINACTSAASFDKTPFYPSLAPNGVLPPLP